MNVTLTRQVQDFEFNLNQFEEHLNNPKSVIDDKDFGTIQFFSDTVDSLQAKHVDSATLNQFRNQIARISDLLLDSMNTSGKDEKKEKPCPSRALKPSLPGQSKQTERITRLPSNDAFLAQAIERMQRFMQVQKQIGDGLRERADHSSPHEKARLEEMLATSCEKTRQKSPTRQIEIAKAKLSKQTVSDEEVADLCGKSLAAFRAERIYAAFAKIQWFNKELIAQELGISLSTLDSWLILAEKEVWLNELLTLLGAETKQNKVKIIFFKHYLDDLRIFLEELERQIQNFKKPLHVLKMHNVLRNLDLIQTDGAVDLAPFKQKCEQLIKKMIGQLKGRRQSSLALLAQTPSTTPELRDLIAAKTFTLAKSTPILFGLTSTLTLSNAKGIHPQAYIERVCVLAKAAKAIVEECIHDTSKYETKKKLLPESVVEFLDCQKHALQQALQIVSTKLSHVVGRQEKRKRLLELGFIFDPPIYFHGTSTLEGAFSIATTGIRPAHGRAFYGAFHSTYPAMLLYGNVIVGLGSKAAYTSGLGSAISQGWIWSSQEPLFMPDKRSDISRSLFHHQTKEKWIGLRDLTTLNPKVNELNARFYAAFSRALFEKSKMFCKNNGETFNEKEFLLFESELLASLEKYHLTFSFSQSLTNAAKGTWTCQIEDIFSPKRGQFVTFNTTQLQGHFLLAQRLRRFQSYLQENMSSFFAQINTYLNDQREPPEPKGFCGQAISHIFKRAIKFISESFTFTYFQNEIKVTSARHLPLSSYIITVDEEPLLLNYFQDSNIWQRAHYGNYFSQAQIRSHYSAALGFSFTDDESGRKQKEIHDVFLDTHVVSLLEQLIEFDFTTKDGVRTLKEWVE
jgi:hypothetical protein